MSEAHISRYRIPTITIWREQDTILFFSETYSLGDDPGWIYFYMTMSVRISMTNGGNLIIKTGITPFFYCTINK